MLHRGFAEVQGLPSNDFKTARFACSLSTPRSSSSTSRTGKYPHFFFGGSINKNSALLLSERHTVQGVGGGGSCQKRRTRTGTLFAGKGVWWMVQGGGGEQISHLHVVSVHSPAPDPASPGPTPSSSSSLRRYSSRDNRRHRHRWRCQRPRPVTPRGSDPATFRQQLTKWQRRQPKEQQ